MNEIEVTRPQEPEEKLYKIDPALLVKHNPATKIVNPKMYHALEENFTPEKFEPLYIAKVKTFSPERGTVVKPLILDGMTRAKYAFDNKGKGIPFFDAIPTQDMTHTMTMNLSVMGIDERGLAESGLSVFHYLKAVMPYAFIHREIAPQRVVTHIMQGWDNTVGYITAKNISALRALHYLRDSFYPLVASHLRLHVEKLLDVENAFAQHNLSPEEQERVRQGFMLLASIIQIEGLDRHTLTKVADSIVKARVQAKKPVYEDSAKGAIVVDPEIRIRRPQSIRTSE